MYHVLKIKKLRSFSFGVFVKRLALFKSLHILLKELMACFEGFEGVAVYPAAVLLDDVVLYADLFCQGEHAVPIDVAVADFGVGLSHGAVFVEEGLNILEVKNVDSACKLFEPEADVCAAVCYPAGVKHE